jgi:signal transduction histidine kinase/DNA-binding response OmpR family regulator
MRTLLTLTKQPAMAAALEAALQKGSYQLIVKEDLWEAESLLTRGAIDAAILDLELTDVRAIRQIEQLKQTAPDVPLIVCASAKQSEWEEDAYLLGVTHIITKPIRAKLLNTLLERIFKDDQQTPASGSSRSPVPVQNAMAMRSHHQQLAHPQVQQSAAPEQFRALEALRHFSGVLTHSLNPEALLKQFLLLLREIIGVNRAVIFLRKPASLLSESAHSQEDRWLRSACAIGLEHSFLEHFALSLTAGIGACLRRQGRILKAGSAEAQNNREILKEFQLLGAQVAIPILDRETLIGVAVFDERLTGETYANEELALIFHMLEEVGLAIRNSWLHDQLVANHTMVADILGTLGSGCVVVSTSLAVLHANASAQQIFLAGKGGKRQLEFADLPQEIGSRVFTVMKTGTGIQPFRYQFPNLHEVVFNVNISPFRTQDAAVPNAALLIIEDITQVERAQRLELEASSLRLITSMAEHLAHEIGNSVLPISTHQQLLTEGDNIEDPEFRDSLSVALSDGVKRISRLASQMMFLARGKADYGDQVLVSDVVSDAFSDAFVYHTGKTPDYNIMPGAKIAFTIAGDQKALRHAFAEVLLNALQSTPPESKVAVRITREGADGGRKVAVEVHDLGKGFTKEIAARAPEPFFSTRNVGLGLGLTVTRKIIEEHRGQVEIRPTDTGVVRISLPLSDQN